MSNGDQSIYKKPPSHPSRFQRQQGRGGVRAAVYTSSPAAAAGGV